MWLPDENENEQLRRTLSITTFPSSYHSPCLLKNFSYFSSLLLLLNLPSINPVKLLSLMRLTTSEFTNLVGEFLELFCVCYTREQTTVIWKFSSPGLMLCNTFPITSRCGCRFSIPFISSPLAKHLILEFFLIFFSDVLDFSGFTFFLDDFTYFHLSSTCIKFSDSLLQLCHLF